MNHKKLAVGLLAGLLATATIQAQDKPQHPKMDREEKFKKLDLNSDGKISKEEADKAEHTMIGKHFAQIDSNKDGAISKEEFLAFKPKGGSKKVGK